MTRNKIIFVRDILVLIIVFAFILFLHGAVPFFATPTLGQALWSTGFSQSFVNESIFTVYAKNFGFPQPAAISFGLAGAWPVGLFIKLGLHPVDAYSLMVASWLALAFFSSYKICRIFGSSRILALLSALLWMSMPIIWGHAGYSMLSLGIALLPFYFLAGYNLFITNSKLSKPSLFHIGIYIFAVFISVFMDGYTFMMFAVGGSLFGAYVICSIPDFKKSIYKYFFPIHILSFVIAYLTYVLFIGRSTFESSSEDFFRGWGLDLSFIAIPTEGVFWVFDALGLSKERSDVLYFGDDSVWVTTFCLPIILMGGYGWWRIRRQAKIATGFLLLAIFGFYMALGPSLKINSTKPEWMQKTMLPQLSVLMPSEMAVMPTGNAIVLTLPGFNAMRASYRWSALGIFACWMLLVFSLSIRRPKIHTIVPIVLIVLVGMNLPNLIEKWSSYRNNREQFFDIDQRLVLPLKKVLNPHELIAFLPYGNDFLTNYVASRLNIKTFNIGGDKNLLEAQKKWPSCMFNFKNELNDAQVNDIFSFLLSGSCDVIVLSRFDGSHAAHYWPEMNKPNQQQLVPLLLIQNLKSIPFLDVIDSELFVVVRLRPEFSTVSRKKEIINEMLAEIEYPISFFPNKNINSILETGWHSVELGQVWSSSKSILTLPIPEYCQDTKCTVALTFGVFGASRQRPVAVNFSEMGEKSEWHNLIVSTEDEVRMYLPLPRGKSSVQISIEVPNAISPKDFTGSPDERILGISLRQIFLIKSG